MISSCFPPSVNLFYPILNFLYLKANNSLGNFLEIKNNKYFMYYFLFLLLF